MDIVNEIKAKSAELLRNEAVEVVIGFAKGTVEGRCTPYFARKEEDLENLVWERGCNINLANYLVNRKEKAAIIAKGCDSRSIVNLIKENQVSRDNIIIIGADCPSTEDCKTCSYPSPVIADIDLSRGLNKENDDFLDVKNFSKLSIEDRRNYIYGEISRCIRCYACRNACPACYCKECFVEENLPSWIGKTTEMADNMIFHLTRAIHVAGRCVGCGACTRACPMGVDLAILNRKMLFDIEQLFNTKPGVDIDSELPLNTYSENDPEPFLIGGGKCE